MGREKIGDVLQMSTNLEEGNLTWRRKELTLLEKRGCHICQRKGGKVCCA